VNIKKHRASVSLLKKKPLLLFHLPFAFFAKREEVRQTGEKAIHSSRDAARNEFVSLWRMKSGERMMAREQSQDKSPDKHRLALSFERNRLLRG